jgi:hypothetical protein
VAAVHQRGAGGLIGVVAAGRALDALEPLLRAYGEVAVASEPDDLAGDADAVLIVGDRRRSPRTVLSGPFLLAANGRRVPVGWVPDTGWDAVRRFAEAAARIHERRGRERTVAVLAQRSRRYRDLSGRIVRLLEESRGAVRPLRWTADELGREELGRGLGYGLAAAVYVGHGRPTGWAGYRGTRAHHLDDADEPAAAVLSLTCLTASRRRVGLSFAEALVLQGAAGAAFGAVCPTDHRWNARWALRLTRALGSGCATVGELVLSAEQDDPAVAGYRIVGDPVAPLVDAPGAAERADALSREVALTA